MYIVSNAMLFNFWALALLLPLSFLVLVLVLSLTLSSLFFRAAEDGEEVEPCWVVVDQVSSSVVGQWLWWVGDILFFPSVVCESVCL